MSRGAEPILLALLLVATTRFELCGGGGGGASSSWLYAPELGKSTVGGPKKLEFRLVAEFVACFDEAPALRALPSATLVEGPGTAVIVVSPSASSLAERDLIADAVSGSTLALTTLPFPINSVAGDGVLAAPRAGVLGRSLAFCFFLALSDAAAEVGGKSSTDGGSSSTLNRLAICRLGDSEVGLAGPSAGGRGAVAKP